MDGQLHDAVDAVLLRKSLDRARRANVALLEDDRIADERREERRHTMALVERRHDALAGLGERSNGMRADESQPAGDKRRHRIPPEVSERAALRTGLATVAYRVPGGPTRTVMMSVP